jgi:hypothetical protein
MLGILYRLQFSNACNFVLQVVKTFFRTNRNTCLEWLSRIRMCLMTVAAHAGMPAVVVRHAHELLSDLLDIDSTQVKKKIKTKQQKYTHTYTHTYTNNAVALAIIIMCRMKKS